MEKKKIFGGILNLVLIVVFSLLNLKFCFAGGGLEGKKTIPEKTPISVSVIIPVYNSAPYLERCLDSVNEQTMPKNKIEIICVNDGSTDNSLEILEKYKTEKRPDLIIFDQKNSGPSVARNKGLEQATGEYVVFTDSDDWVEKNHCEILFDASKKNNADIAQSRIVYHEMRNKKDWSLVVDEKPKEQVEVLKENSPLGMFIYKPGGFVTDKMIRRKFLEDHKIRFDPELKGPEDTVFVMQCYGNSECSVHCPQGLYNYNRHDGSISDWRDASKRLNYMGEALQKGIDVFLGSKYGGDLKYRYHLFMFCLEWAVSVADSTRMDTEENQEPLRNYRRKTMEYLNSDRFSSIDKKTMPRFSRWLYYRMMALSR
ncbi:MAG: glycosyltransferase [Oscillospiraceae bacterium]|jgi:glycosyltransferase involved in cell wall biosynthesis|nr:glycosyltransferase [Oscillospiraceae bacterium]